MDKEIYRAPGYDPAKVTGRYARHVRKLPRGQALFRVFETATGTGPFAGQPGMGSTLREYDTDGRDLPADVRARLAQSKRTEKLD